MSAGVDDVGQVRLARLAQRRRHADDDGVGLGEAARIGGGLETAAADQLGDALGADVADVAFAAVELGDLVGVDVEAEHGIAAPGEGLGQRQADVAESDDGDTGRAFFDAVEKLIRQGH